MNKVLFWGSVNSGGE